MHCKSWPKYIKSFGILRQAVLIQGIPEAVEKQEQQLAVVQAFGMVVLRHCTAGTLVGTQGAAGTDGLQRSAKFVIARYDAEQELQ